MSWIFWGSTLLLITLIFYTLWRYSDKIERAEVEETQWKQWVENQEQIDPYTAEQAHQMFEDKFMR